MNQDPPQERKLLCQYQFDQLDQDSDFFKKRMSENLKEFGYDGHYTPVEDGNLTDLGKRAMAQATTQLESWLFLDPYKLRRFIQYSCPWTSTDGNYIEQKTEALVNSIWEDQSKLKPLAQIMIRLSERARNRYLVVQKVQQANKQWLVDNFGAVPEDQNWDLGMPVLNAMMQHMQTLLESIASGNLPIWVYVAEVLSSVMKVVALYAIQREKTDRNVKTMAAIRKSMSVVETLIKNDLNRKPKPRSSVSSLDETNSPPLTPTMSSPKKGENLQKFPMNSENNKNIINKQINNIYLYKNMEGGNQKPRPELKPEDYLKNFYSLCQTVGLQDKAEPLFRLLRECYTNPLCYLGPPKNLPTDLSSLSQPLTVSRESWKSKRIHSLENRTCARCGKKGHLPANCTQEIHCSKCGGTGHATKGCKVAKPLDEKKMEEEDKKSPKKSRSQKSHRGKRGSNKLKAGAGNK